MKTALEITDDVLRHAREQAARAGVPLDDFVAGAVRDKLRGFPESANKPWMEFFGSLRHLHDETMRIDRTIEAEFESIEPADWI